jgi:hypothetical protein
MCKLLEKGGNTVSGKKETPLGREKSKQSENI